MKSQEITEPSPAVNEALPAPKLEPVDFPFAALHSDYDGPLAPAYREFRRREYDKARALLSAPSADEPVAATLLRARIDAAQERWLSAGEGYAKVAQREPLIADKLHAAAARAFARVDDPRAREQAQMVPDSSPWATEVAFLRAEIARAQGERTDAANLYRQYLKAGGTFVDEARFRLGELLRADQPQESNKVWRELVLRHPLSPFAQQVRELTPKIEAALTAPELMVRGRAYFAAMRNPLSEADFAAAIDVGGLSKEGICDASYHRAKSAFKEREYRRAAGLAATAAKACAGGINDDLGAKSAYVAGMAFARVREREEALRWFEEVEAYSSHSYADDGLLRQAEELFEMERPKEAIERLETLTTKFPEGDMRGEAMWRLARRAYFEGDYELAVKWLEAYKEAIPVERTWWAEGLAPYWLGRSLARLGKNDQAIAAYEETIATYPLTYYSLQAFQRLRELDPKRHASVVKEKAELGPAVLPSLKAQSVYASEGFQKALRLAQLKMSASTRQALEAVGLNVPAGRDPVQDANQQELLVATMFLLDLADNHERSHWIGRWHAVEYRRHWPEGAMRTLWRLAYPLAFWDLLQEFAAKHTYPPHLQMAIVREESAFDPERESWANAIGLTQMIFPTAKDHSKGTGIEPTRANLQHPVKNVTIGSNFLQSLMEAFEGREGLMVPGYNAGRARVRGWIRQRHKLDLDEFIELIPGDQARRYTKRVLGSYFAYRFLDGGVIPEFANEVPRRLGRR